MSAPNSSKVPFVDLNRQHGPLKAEFTAAFHKTLEPNNFILGPRLEEFEKAFAEWVGAKHAVGVATGTDALHLALRAIGVGPGDEVIVPAMTFAATALAALYSGATPVAVDVRSEDALMDPAAVVAAITPKTKAILPVHLYGKACDLEALKKVTEPKGIAIIEDACQAHGTLYKGKRVGTFGVASAFSFFPSKNLGALGDGGIVVTNDSKVYEALTALRNYGQRIRYHHDSLGFNSRLDGLQAAFLTVKLPHLEKWNQMRKDHAARYIAGLKGLPLQVLSQPATPTADHIFHLFVVRSPEREALQKHLSESGIETGIHYPFSIPQLGFAKGVIRSTSCPKADQQAREGFSLPMFPELRNDEIDRVIEAIHQFYKGKTK